MQPTPSCTWCTSECYPLSWRAIQAGEDGRGNRGRDPPQDGVGRPGDCGFGQGAWGGSDRDGLPGPSRDKEGHRREYLRWGYPPRSLPGPSSRLARESRSLRAVCPAARRLIKAPMGPGISKRPRVRTRGLFAASSLVVCVLPESYYLLDLLRQRLLLLSPPPIVLLLPVAGFLLHQPALGDPARLFLLEVIAILARVDLGGRRIINKKTFTVA